MKRKEFTLLMILLFSGFALLKNLRRLLKILNRHDQSGKDYPMVNSKVVQAKLQHQKHNVYNLISVL